MIRKSVKRFSEKITPKLDCQDMDQTGGLFAPMLVYDGPHRAPNRLRQRIRIAAPGLWQTLNRGHDRIENQVVEGLARPVLLGDSDQIDLGIVGELALRGHGDSDESAAGKRHAAPLDHRARLGILENRAVLVE